MAVIVTTEHLEELQNAIRALIGKDTAQALETLQGVIAKNPESPEALHLLGICSTLLGDTGRGIELISYAHEIDGECRDYVDALASLKAKTGDLTTSLYFAKLATTLEPHPSLAHLTPASLQDYAGSLAGSTIPTLMLDAILMFSRRQFSKAVELCEKELRLKPTSLEALRLLGKGLIEIGEYPRAEIALHAAEQIEHGDPETLANLGRCLAMQGKNDDALACFDYARESDADDLVGTAQHLQALSFMDDAHWQTRGEVDTLFHTRAKAIGVEAMEGSDTPPAGKIRIGILSNHFYNCDEALALETFLQNYNRKRFEVFCLQQSITHDKKTDRFKTLCDSWRPVFDLDDWVLASIIAGDGIQALIDMNGYGPGQRRATLNANPATLQVAWLNHLDGTGKGVIDLVLADAATVDVDRRTALDGQEVAKLESGLFAFSEFGLMGDVAPLPALEHDTITFGAYADLARVTPQIAKTWCGILKAVPNSLLVLNVQPNLPDAIRSQLSARFAHFGMTKRIAFLTPEPKSRDSKTKDPEQAFLAGVDILLDASANAQAGQIARALWMGVPVLTQNTGRRSGLIAASILIAADKGEWVAASPDELIATAQALTQNFDDLSAIRQSLRDEIRDSSLFKGRDFAREIETAIEMAMEDKGII